MGDRPQKILSGRGWFDLVCIYAHVWRFLYFCKWNYALCFTYWIYPPEIKEDDFCVSTVEVHLHHMIHCRHVVTTVSTHFFFMHIIMVHMMVPHARMIHWAMMLTVFHVMVFHFVVCKSQREIYNWCLLGALRNLSNHLMWTFVAFHSNEFRASKMWGFHLLLLKMVWTCTRALPYCTGLNDAFSVNQKLQGLLSS